MYVATYVYKHIVIYSIVTLGTTVVRIYEKNKLIMVYPCNHIICMLSYVACK